MTVVSADAGRNPALDRAAIGGTPAARRGSRLGEMSHRRRQTQRDPDCPFPPCPLPPFGGSGRLVTNRRGRIHRIAQPAPDTRRGQPSLNSIRRDQARTAYVQPRLCVHATRSLLDFSSPLAADSRRAWGRLWPPRSPPARAEQGSSLVRGGGLRGRRPAGAVSTAGPRSHMHPWSAAALHRFAHGGYPQARALVDDRRGVD